VYQLRPATTADYDFLYQLHRATIRPAVAAMWGWDEAWQQAYFAQKFDPAQRQIIAVEGQDVGVVAIEERDEEIYLALIEVAPEQQNRGLGTTVIRDILQRAQQQQRPVSLHVLKTNPAGQRLYERLGFVVTAVEEFKYKMQHLL
jgi:ribosomal protein S18 acetylase RimI-like enzyme